MVRCQEGGGFGRAVQAGLTVALPRANGGYVGWLPGNLKSDPLDAVRLTNSLHAFHTYGSAYVEARRSGRPIRERIPFRSILAHAVLGLSSSSIRRFSLDNAAFMVLSGSPYDWTVVGHNVRVVA